MSLSSNSVNIEELRRSLEQKSSITTREFYELMHADIQWHWKNLQLEQNRAICLEEALTSWSLYSRSGFFAYWAPKIISA